MSKEFLSKTTLIRYSKDTCQRQTFEKLEDINLTETQEEIQWLNTYGINFHAEFKEVILKNQLDDFLIKLLVDPNHSNKVIPLSQMLFISIKVLKTESKTLGQEQMIFLFSPGFIWSIQEKKGDYFEWIRERLTENIGLVRKKKADYLFFLILESIVDNYHEAQKKFSKKGIQDLALTEVKPTPEYTLSVERKKQRLFRIKKAVVSLRDTITKLENVELRNFNNNYFSEIKEQATNIIADTDFEIQDMESKMNLIYSIQGHKLNEVMKTLTIFSVIFIPLTFLAGIYGMNFDYIPELKWPNGYFILLGVMVVMAALIIWYISRKKWF